MPKSKERLRAVLDTNVLIRHFIDHARGRKAGFNRRVFELWFIKNQIQLVVSPNIVDEYINTMALMLGIADDTLKKWRGRFASHNVDVVSPGKEYPSAVTPKTTSF